MYDHQNRALSRRGVVSNFLDLYVIKIKQRTSIKKTRIQSGNAQVQEVGRHAAEDQNKSELLVGK